MAAIDDKVVAMSFESGKFESGVNSVISALEKLKASLKLPTSAKGLEDVGAAAKKIDLSHIGKGIDEVQSKLSALNVAAVAIFANIALTAFRAGADLVKSLSIEPILAGYKEYSTNLNSIQTILANTEASGATLDDVNAALLQLNKYSDKTIYNFSQMARNIGTFTAAGVDLDTSTNAIKGIANLAALSGSSADQASTAMYQLSQAIAAGSVKLQDWNSVVNAGMGGTVFQRALAQTAEAMGTLKEGTVKLTGPMKNVTIAGEAFRQSLSTPGKASWLTSKVLTQTLKQFTGDLKNADLAAMGFNASQIKAIQQTAKTAQHAATEVKTLSQVLDVAKETAGSGWAQTWQIIFGNFGEAKKTFTGLSNAVNGFLNASAHARNSVLTDWKALGGRTVLIEAITTAFHNLGLILKPIKNAFRDIFPAKTGQDLLNLTWAFQDFAEALKPTPATMDRLRRTFAGLFAIFDIGKQLIEGVFHAFGKLFEAADGGGSGFLKITANIGDFLVKLDEALKKGNGLNKFFEGIGTALSVPVKLLRELANILSEVFGGFSSEGFSGEVNGMTKSVDIFHTVLEKIAAVWDRFLDSIGDGVRLLEPFAKAYADLMSGIGDAIGQAASNMNFDAIFQVIRTGLFAGLVLMFKNFLGKGSFLQQISRVGSGLTSGILGNISGAFRGLNGSMQAMQTNIKAKTLKEIAIAIALLVGSVVALSFVDPKKVSSALGSITIMMGQLLGAMALLNKIAATGGFLKLPVMAFGLILLAGAIDVLVIAVFALSRLSWEDLAKGLGGVAFLLLAISKAVVPLSANAGGMIRAGIGITAIAASMVILSAAVKIMGSMDLADLAKGLVGVTVGLGVMVAAMTKMPVIPLRSSIGLIALAGALVIMAGAIKIMGSMDLAELGKGLGGLAGGLGAMVIAMNLMPAKSSLRNAAALLILASAMGVMAGAIKLMGGMSVKELATGLTALGGALLLMTTAMRAMQGSVRGAITLGIIAGAMAVLAPALVLMGKQSWTELVKGLITLGGALVIIGTAGKLLAPVVPAMLGFGVALLAIGAGLALAGAGIFLIGLGLSAIAVAGPAAVGIMVAAMRELLEGIIENSKLLILGLLEIVEALAKTAPKFVAALVKIINSLLDVVIQASPKIGEAFVAILTVALKVIKEQAPKIIDAGFQLITDFLLALREQVPLILPIAVDIIVEFLKGLAKEAGRIVKAGADLLVGLLKGIADNIGNVVTAVGNIITKFLGAIASNITKITAAGANILVKFLEGIAKGVSQIITAATGIVVRFVEGIAKSYGKIVTAGADAMISFIEGLGKNTLKIVNAAGEAILTFLQGLHKAIDKYSPQITEEAIGIGEALITGIMRGLARKAEELYQSARNIVSNVLNIWRKIPGISSPSKVTTEIGEFLILGMQKGLQNNSSGLYTSATAISNNLINTFRTVFGIKSPSTVMEEIGKFVGQGFAKGLKGSSEDINSAFLELNGMLTDAMKTAQETILTEQDKLKKLREAAKPDADAISKSVAIIEKNEELLRRSTAGHLALTVALQDEKKKLLSLSDDYEKIGNKLDAAKTKLATLKQERDDLVKNTASQYATLPDIVTTDAEGHAVDQLGTYMEALDTQAKAVAAYRSTLDQLRKLGLDDATYQKLLEEGTADQEFATQLLAGGKTAVEGLNKLDTQLNKQAKILAQHAGRDLKQAGIEAVKGLVQGLEQDKQSVINAVKRMADEIVAAFRLRIGIRSPSTVFAEAGRYAMLGLAKGISDSTNTVVGAIDDAASSALNALKNSMQNISDMVTGEINTNPIITPVLDLTKVRSQVGELGALTNVVPISAAASFGQASAILSEDVGISAEDLSKATGPMVTYEQNNYSPKALSEIEIYRQTRNQLSQLKTTLGVT